MKLFIHPMYNSRAVLRGFTVTTCRGQPLVDEEIREHFPVEATGKEMREAFPEDTLEWSGALSIEGV